MEEITIAELERTNSVHLVVLKAAKVHVTRRLVYHLAKAVLFVITKLSHVHGPIHLIVYHALTMLDAVGVCNFGDVVLTGFGLSILVLTFLVLTFFFVLSIYIFILVLFSGGFWQLEHSSIVKELIGVNSQTLQRRHHFIVFQFHLDFLCSFRAIFYTEFTS